MNLKQLLLAIGGIIILGTLLSLQTSSMTPKVEHTIFEIGCLQRGGVNCIIKQWGSYPLSEYPELFWIFNDPSYNKTNPTTDQICIFKNKGKSIDSVTLPHNTYREYYYWNTNGYFKNSTEGNQVYTCLNSITCEGGKISC